ncbi:cyclic nucleotide-binding domain-containing protein [candidate division GN15 bacterium]|nr:cyclic nucleotide-binding domain-containing protein [candidate division GN15 bacterium]
MENLDLLRQCYLLRGLADEELTAVAGIASVRTINEGEVLFLQGDPAVGFYAVLSGTVRVFKSSPQGREYTLHRIPAGQIFAEAAIFDGEAYPANAVAVQKSTVAFFPADRFRTLIAGSPQLSLKMIGSLSGFVRDFNQQIEDLSLKEVPSRLASYLRRRAEQTRDHRVLLESSKTELAQSLGTVLETLSRSFRKLQDMGVIAVKERSIEILDPDRLDDIASGEKM